MRVTTWSIRNPRWPIVPLQIRLLVTIAIILAVNSAVILAVAWSGYRLLGVAGPSVVPSVSVLVISVGVLLGSPGLAFAQARYGYRKVLDDVDASIVDGHTPRDLVDRLTGLAFAAEVPPPAVALVDETTPNGFTVGNGTNATVVVTTGLLAELDDSELQAVLAHEIAHIANHDAVVATIVATFTTVSERLFRRERLLADWLRVALALAPVRIELLLYVVPVIAGFVIFLVLGVVTRVILAINAICSGVYAQSREYTADRFAAELTGEPAALASALQALTGDSPPTEDLRLSADGSLGIVPRPIRSSHGIWDDDIGQSLLVRWFTVDDPVAGSWLHPDARLSRVLGRFARALEWRPTTHPPTETRIHRLTQLTIDRETV